MYRPVSALALFLLLSGTAYADDPMNQPLDSLGVHGYDTTLCSDRWSNCSEYDRSQFDTKYPGTTLDSISLYSLETETREAIQTYRSAEFLQGIQEDEFRYSEGKAED